MLHNHVTGRRMIGEIVTVVRREYSLSPTMGMNREKKVVNVSLVVKGVEGTNRACP